jgi:hypothetical protein
MTELRQRDARDLAAMDAAAASPTPVWDVVPGGEVAETAVRVDGAPVPAWWARDVAGDVALHRSRELAVVSLAPPPAPVPVPPRRPSRWRAGRTVG